MRGVLGWGGARHVLVGGGPPLPLCKKVLTWGCSLCHGRVLAHFSRFFEMGLGGSQPVYLLGPPCSYAAQPDQPKAHPRQPHPIPTTHLQPPPTSHTAPGMAGPTTQPPLWWGSNPPHQHFSTHPQCTAPATHTAHSPCLRPPTLSHTMWDTCGTPGLWLGPPTRALAKCHLGL